MGLDIKRFEKEIDVTSKLKGGCLSDGDVNVVLSKCIKGKVCRVSAADIETASSVLERKKYFPNGEPGGGYVNVNYGYRKRKTEEWENLKNHR